MAPNTCICAIYSSTFRIEFAAKGLQILGNALISVIESTSSRLAFEEPHHYFATCRKTPPANELQLLGNTFIPVIKSKSFRRAFDEPHNSTLLLARHNLCRFAFCELRFKVTPQPYAFVYSADSVPNRSMSGTSKNAAQHAVFAYRAGCHPEHLKPRFDSDQSEISSTK